MAQVSVDVVDISDTVVAVVGLGYVGLPLALALGRTDLKTYGFDINATRIEQLRQGHDVTNEVTAEEFASSRLEFTADPTVLAGANMIIIAVPTPVDSQNVPDLTILEKASELVGRQLQAGSIVVYESTVYPGATEEVCLPILEKASGLKAGQDFKVGYSPERINPGDKEHTLERVVKIVSAQDAESTAKVAAVYETVCQAGVFVAADIKTAEAAKVIENTQRDLNIALMNELSMIFHQMGIDTQAVLAAAGTKWNFHPYRPGLVGGHCIGVDPYYLIYQATAKGYTPQLISAARRVNDGMDAYVAEAILTQLKQAGRPAAEARIVVAGLTFKPDVKDVRNSRVGEVIRLLQKEGVTVFGYDPLLTDEEMTEEFPVSPVSGLDTNYDGLVIAAPHKIFDKEVQTFHSFLKDKKFIVDVAGMLKKELPSIPAHYWSL